MLFMQINRSRIAVLKIYTALVPVYDYYLLSVITLQYIGLLIIYRRKRIPTKLLSNIKCISNHYYLSILYRVLHDFSRLQIVWSVAKYHSLVSMLWKYVVRILQLPLYRDYKNTGKCLLPSPKVIMLLLCLPI
jgi:hypothetical protein